MVIEQYKGEICALLAPLAWSTALILYRKTDAPPVAMNLFKNVLASVLLGLTMLAIGEPIPMDRSPADWARLIASGLAGLAFADVLLFHALAKVGAARMAVVDTVYAPLVVLLSWLLLGEHFGLAFAVGASAVVLGIGIATVQRGALALDQREQWIGMAYGTLAIASTAAAVVLAKPVLEHSSLVEVTFIRLVVGVLGQLAGLLWTREWRLATSLFRPSATWKTLVPAAFIGTYVSMMLWLGGYKWAPASTAAILNQMATVYMLVLARTVLGETLRPAQAVGALIAAGGALWIMLYR